MGVVYYGNYLTWFEIGRTDLLRQLGATYRDIERDNVYLPVVEAQCRYLSPARYDDLIDIRTTASRRGKVRVRFDYSLSRADDTKVLAEGSTVHVATNASGRIQRLPERITELFE